MASLLSSPLFLSSSSKRPISSAIRPPKPRNPAANVSVPKPPAAANLKVSEEKESLVASKNNVRAAADQHFAVTSKLYAILEAVADRVEMHDNVGEQRNNWNTLLLNSINTITLAAATMAGASAALDGAGEPLLAFKLSSTLLFSASAGMLMVMNKIQPSQLAEEQRNAARLFRQIQAQIETALAVGSPGEDDVDGAMEKVLALDKAYPLPLIGVMIEKFPETFQPAVWWPGNGMKGKELVEKECNEENNSSNGWSERMEMEMRDVVKVLKRKDAEDYMRLGNIGLKINKVLAVSGPLLTGAAAIASALPGPRWASTLAVAAGALASIVNTLEHGGQVGMLLEMYRNCAGFFQNMEESIQSTLEESEVQRRENGEVFEMKVALRLGRSLLQLRDLAGDADSTNEFASKLF